MAETGRLVVNMDRKAAAWAIKQLTRRFHFYFHFHSGGFNRTQRILILSSLKDYEAYDSEPFMERERWSDDLCFDEGGSECRLLRRIA